MEFRNYIRNAGDLRAARHDLRHAWRRRDAIAQHHSLENTHRQEHLVSSVYAVPPVYTRTRAHINHHSKSSRPLHFVPLASTNAWHRCSPAHMMIASSLSSSSSCVRAFLYWHRSSLPGRSRRRRRRGRLTAATCSTSDTQTDSNNKNKKARLQSSSLIDRVRRVRFSV